MRTNYLKVALVGAMAAAMAGFTSSCSDDGVVINGVKWATCNVDAPGTFAESPEAPGMLYQWNRKKAWPTTGAVSGWDDSASGHSWAAANDPSPAGWRVPTPAEIESLLDESKVRNEWTTQRRAEHITTGTLKNGQPFEITSVHTVHGRKFTDKTTGVSLFLPAVGYRDIDGAFKYVNEVGYYWGSTASGTGYAYTMGFGNAGAEDDNFNRRYGFSIRCVSK